MPGRGAPSFLKRQKEQQRVARANAKRAAKQARRDNRAAAAKAEEDIAEGVPAEPTEQDSETEDPSSD